MSEQSAADRQLTEAYRRPHTVATLTFDGIHDESARLYKLVTENQEHPTHIIGIASAGTFVSRAMLKTAPEGTIGLEIHARRPTTRFKQLLQLKAVLRRLPTRVTDRLRVLEHRWITRQLPLCREVTMPPEDRDVLITAGRWARLLLVDDCVDTGASLRASHEYLVDLTRGHVDVQTAALTVSVKDPVERPTFSLYENRTFRGPWSSDT